MRKYLFIVIYFCVSDFILAQSSVQKRIHFSQSQAAFSMDVLEFSKNRFVLFGTSYDSTQSGSHSDLTLVLVDENGNTVWRKAFYDSSFSPYFSLGCNRLLAKMGNCLYSINDAMNSNRIVGVFNKYDANGDTLFSKKIIDGNLSAGLYFRSINSTLDKCFLMTGSVITPSPGYNGNPTYGMFLLKADSLGNILWFKKHYSSNLNMQYEGYDLIEDPITKKIFVTGTRLLLNQSYQGVLWILDNQGNLISIKGTNNEFGIITRSITRRETGNIIFGGIKLYSNYFGGGIDGISSLLIETDSLGNLYKKIEFDTISIENGFSRLVCLKNGDLISNGIYENLNRYGLGHNNILRVAKFDPELNLKWKKYFDNYTSNSNYDGTNSLLYTQNGELVFTSDCQNCNDTSPMTFMFYRTDTNYCDLNAISCYSYTMVGLSKENRLENEIQVYPNPTTDKIIIQKHTNGLVTFNMLNSVGQMLLDQKSKSFSFEVDLSQFPKGIYFIRIENENGTLFKKVIKD